MTPCMCSILNVMCLALLFSCSLKDIFSPRIFRSSNSRLQLKSPISNSVAPPAVWVVVLKLGGDSCPVVKDTFNVRVAVEFVLDPLQYVSKSQLGSDELSHPKQLFSLFFSEGSFDLKLGTKGFH